MNVNSVNPPSITYDDYELYISGDKTHQAFYKIKAVDSSGNQSPYSSYTRIWYDGVQKDEIAIHEVLHEFKVSQNHPNPFNPGTAIEYILSYDEFVTAKVHNVVG